jgi:Xaa-Pro aminopeptidase
MAQPPFDERLARVRSAMESAHFTGLIITCGTSLRWLTGFTGSSGAAWIDAESTAFATDGRYRETVRKGLPGWELVDSRTPVDALISACADRSPGPIGLPGDVPWRETEQLRLATPRPLVDDDDIIQKLRVRKDATELAALRAASQITDDAVMALYTELAPGITERDAAWRFEQLVRERGADGVAFPPIVAFGASSAHPHHTSGERPLERGDLVLTDVGARVDGYCADMTRTVAFGTIDPVARGMHEVVQRAQAAGRGEVRAGVAAAEVDAAVRAVLAEAGMVELFVHGTGHGVGLDIHEAPLIGPSSAAILEAASTVTVEPGVYLPDVGGIRIEDLLLVGDTEADSLTQLPRDLIVL